MAVSSPVFFIFWWWWIYFVHMRKKATCCYYYITVVAAEILEGETKGCGRCATWFPDHLLSAAGQVQRGHGRTK